MTRTSLTDVACSIARATDLFADAWTALIMRDVLVGVTRFDDLARDLVEGAGSVTRTHLDPTAVTALLDSHQRGRRDESIRIWTLASLEMWHRELYGAFCVK